MSDFTIDDALALRVEEGFHLSDVDPSETPGFEGDSDELDEAFHSFNDLLDEEQEKLFANGRKHPETTGGILLVLQGMDTSGKGGVIRHVVRQLDPQGVHTVGFGRPTEEEAAHDFLWRVEKHLPGPGLISVFDRSHYEDVLVQRVNALAPPEEIERRYGAIVDFESRAAANGITIIKVMLHISRAFQKKNLMERLERPDKHWKYDPGDLEDRAKWERYQAAYQIALERTSTDDAPWYCVPGDNKKYARMVVKALIADALKSMELEWPEADFDPEEEKKRLKKS
ncbi:PPK2 family polyphosphate--nucleotide phosphotransferase [Corynebacterium breve]|uniref:PPK2 family polyphosphate--nucleotide phosphotransferase n=1 Tax=Corynebacterium breve TaxID=3049799 RepID=A0ABY8VGY3_9CORY|nr:PPK2 family polyphosphate kinase [Corynebacterium breve]WIM68921.1 PPK2 family polyphosphate--nucleotide phosphotransferase [Corynebacterium breve]